MHTTFRFFLTIVISAATVTVTANATVISFALSNKSSMLLCLGAIFPFILFLMIAFFGAMYTAVFFAGIRAEMELDKNVPMFFSVLLSIMSRDYYKRCREIILKYDNESQIEQFQKYPAMMLPPFALTLLTALSAIQIIAAAVLWSKFDWPIAINS
jgi:hypothetical protein